MMPSATPSGTRLNPPATTIASTSGIRRRSGCADVGAMPKVRIEVLVDAGILAREKRGYWTWYSIVPSRLTELAAVLA